MQTSALSWPVSSMTSLQGTGEAHEDQHVYCEQVGQEEISRAGTTSQQPGEVEAPPSEPVPTHNHPTFHLQGATAHGHKRHMQDQTDLFEANVN